MKTNGDHPSSPTITVIDGNWVKNTPKEATGLTKREHMAIEFAKAFIGIEYSNFEECVKCGIVTADMMINALNKEDRE